MFEIFENTKYASCNRETLVGWNICYTRVLLTPFSSSDSTVQHPLSDFRFGILWIARRAKPNLCVTQCETDSRQINRRSQHYFAALSCLLELVEAAEQLLDAVVAVWELRRDRGEGGGDHAVCTEIVGDCLVGGEMIGVRTWRSFGFGGDHAVGREIGLSWASLLLGGRSSRAT
eukprot:6194444-Pleurochrysis_carterae.AAC.1